MTATATRIESVTHANLYTNAGLMARDSLAANARNNTGGYEFRSRDTTAGTSTTIYPSSPQPAVRYPNAWLRPKRAADVFTSYYPRNGTDWTPLTRNDANFKLSWSSSSRPEQVIPGARLYLPEPWNTWRFDTNNFTLAEQADPLISGENADP